MHLEVFRSDGKELRVQKALDRWQIGFCILREGVVAIDCKGRDGEPNEAKKNFGSQTSTPESDGAATIPRAPPWEAKNPPAGLDQFGGYLIGLYLQYRLL